jgi:hypothetical protein
MRKYFYRHLHSSPISMEKTHYPYFIHTQHSCKRFSNKFQTRARSTHTSHPQTHWLFPSLSLSLSLSLSHTHTHTHTYKRITHICSFYVLCTLHTFHKFLWLKYLYVIVEADGHRNQQSLELGEYFQDKQTMTLESARCTILSFFGKFLK